MRVIELDSEDTVVIPVNKKQHSIEIREETETAAVIYIIPKERGNHEQRKENP